MLDSLKKIDRKFLFIFGGIVGLLILFVIIAILVNLLSGPGKNYESLETKLINATEKYMLNEETPKLEEGEKRLVDVEVLISQDYLKELTKYIDDETCSGYVNVVNNGGFLNYLPYVECAEYVTTTLASKMLEDNLVVNNPEPRKSGLYEQGVEYIFKGGNPNNYVLFGDTLWRVIKIEANGNIRLIKNTPEKSTQWDTDWNTLESDKTGKNIRGVNNYHYSELKGELAISYSNFRDASKQKIVMHDVCVGKRAFEDYTIDMGIDCAEVLSGHYLSTVNTSEIVMASLDEDCNSIAHNGCSNFNYFDYFFSRSWTTIGMLEDTSLVYTVAVGAAREEQASRRNQYFWVLYVSGEERFQSGTGTEEDPYLLG